MQICVEKCDNERASSSVKKKTEKNKITTPWPKARKKREFASQIQVFPGLRPRGGQIRIFVSWPRPRGPIAKSRGEAQVSRNSSLLWA